MTDISVKEKVFRVALCAALVFTLFPISTGNSFVDERTHDQAEAIAPAIPVVAIFATIVIVYGIYVGGTTLDDYNANLDSLFKDFGDFYVGDIEAVLGASWTDDGFINLAAIPADFWAALTEWANGLVSNGTLQTGDSSLLVGSGCFVIGGVNYGVYSSLPSSYSSIASYETSLKSTYPNATLYAINSIDGSDSLGSYHTDSFYYYQDSPPIDIVSANSSGFSVSSYYIDAKTYNGESYNFYFSDSRQRFRSKTITADGFLLNPGVTFQLDGTEYSSTTAVGDGVLGNVTEPVLDGTATIPDATVQPFEPTAEQLESGYTLEDVVEAVDGGAETTGEINETVSGISADVGTIENILSGLRNTPFGWIASFIATVTGGWATLLAWLEANPSLSIDAVLDGGITVDGVTSAIENSTYIGEIADGMSGVYQWLSSSASVDDLFLDVFQNVGFLVTGVNAIDGIVSNVEEWLGSVSLPQLWNDVTGILDGVGDVVSGIDGVGVGIGDVVTGVNGVLAGVNDVSSWWGTLSGWWEGLNQWLGVDGLTLEGVLEGVLSGALAGTLADVIAAINAGVLDIAGTIEGITFPEWPRPDPEPGTRTYDVVGLPNWPDTQINQKLGEKAPFCYVIALNDAFQRASGSYSDNPSFYYELEVPYAGSIVFDAGTWLNYDVHGVSIAWLLRVSFNAFMIVLLLGFVYKSMERALSGS